MTIELRAPAGFGTSQLGAFSLSDGYVMKPNAAGLYELDEAHEMAAATFIAQGWSDEAENRANRQREVEQERARLERQREMSALSTNQILSKCAEQGVRLEVREGKLFMSGKADMPLAGLLTFRRTDLISALSERGWREVT
jgi:hypothetical protein